MRAHDELGDHALHESRRLLGTCFCDTQETLAEGGLGCYPSQAATRGYGFGKGVQAEDAAFVIDTEVGGDEGVQEIIA